jgi:tetratricopeptide (TPR) repeat protein
MDNLFIQSPTLNQKIQIKVNCLLSYIFAKHHKYEVALKYGEKALNSVKYKLEADSLENALINTVLAFAYKNVNKKICLSRCELARNSLDAFDRDSRIRTTFEQSKFVVHVLANVLYELREYDKLMSLCHLCNYQFNQFYVKNHFLSFQWKMNLSKCLFNSGFYLQSIQYTEEVEDSFEDEFFFFKNFRKLFEVQSLLPWQLSKLGFHQKALDHYTNILAKFSVLEDRDVQLNHKSSVKGSKGSVFSLADYVLDMKIARFKFELGRMKCMIKLQSYQSVTEECKELL